MRRKDGTYSNTENILKCINQFNEDGDKSHLWDCYDDLKHCISSLLYKRLKGNITTYFNDNVEIITEKWMLDIVRRREIGNPYKMRSPISYAYWKILDYMPVDDCIMNTAVEYKEYEDTKQA